MKKINKKPKLLLHICCAGCGAYVASALKEEYDLALYFFNPNIFPENEYAIRLKEVKRVAVKFGLEYFFGSYDHGQWLGEIVGYEKEPERGARCRICYRQRLTDTASLAREKGFSYFASTLSVSPHKDSALISSIGNELQSQFGIIFLDKDFKKRDGYKKSLALSRELDLYRQNYCGCEFSRRT